MIKTSPCTTILLTGGAASGKSTFAISLALQFSDPRMVIDTALPDPIDARHLLWREQLIKQNFTLITRSMDLDCLVLPARGTVILECLCHLTANEMFDERGNCEDRTAAILDGIHNLCTQCSTLIAVTNEVGTDHDAFNAGTRSYMKALGHINIALTKNFSYVYEMVCGIPIARKGLTI